MDRSPNQRHFYSGAIVDLGISCDASAAIKCPMAAAEIPNTRKWKERQAAVAILADSYTDGYQLVMYCFVMYCCAVSALLSAVPVIFWWRGTGEKVQVRELQIGNLGQKREQFT